MNRSITYDNILDEFPSKVFYNTYEAYWKGSHQYAVLVKKNHSKLSFGYSPYWFVYGKEKCIHLFTEPAANNAYLVAELRSMKYMTIDKTIINLWNKKKNFNISFKTEEDKLYFDEFYKNTCR